MNLLLIDLGIFLSDDRACTLNSMVDVTGCPSSFFCISLPTSAALSALTASFAMPVHPVEDTRNCLSRSWSKGLIVFGEQVQSLQRLASSVFFGKVFVVLHPECR